MLRSVADDLVKLHLSRQEVGLNRLFLMLQFPGAAFR
jgi:hypothetical protein